MIFRDIANVFYDQGYTLKRNGELFTPNENDIEQLVDKGISLVYDSEEGTTAVLGKMLIRKNHRGKYDVFLWMGEVE